MNKGYEQIFQSLSDKLNRMHNISTLLAVNNTLNMVFRLGEDEDVSIVEQLAYFESVSSYTNAIEMSYDNSRILYFIRDSFVVATDSGNRYRPLSSVTGSAWVREVNGNLGRPTWVKFEKDSSIALVRSLWDSNDFNRSLGILAVILDINDIVNGFIESIPGQLFYLENAAGELFASNLPVNVRLPDRYRRSSGLSGNGFVSFELNGVTYMACSAEVNRSGLFFVSMLPLSSINDASQSTAARVAGLYAVFIMVILTITFYLTNMLLRRLRLLSEQMRASGGNKARLLEIETRTDEIGMLITSYNNMVTEMNSLLTKQFEMGQEKVGAELKALQSQINPHFLYNTLDMVNWMAIKNENENIRETIQAMSRFYRLTLSRGEDIITIRDEIIMCEAYVEIQQKRFSGRIKFIVDIEEGAKDCLIPKITLQPLVENSIIHGINEKSDARGTVTVNGWLDVGRLVLSVTDDGVGMDEGDKFKDVSQGNHYGMRNIEKRLSLFYNEQITVNIENINGAGSCVSISIPAVY
jgi:two-component system sensor histidine kinase YesM